MRDWFKTMDDHLWLRPDEEGEEESRFIKKALCLREGQAVLDAPCGAGRITYHLARSGFIVTGVDLRRLFINRAHRRIRKAGLRGTFLLRDLRELNFVDQFHGICNWGGSFGYFTDTDNFDVVQLYARALRAGGHLLIGQRNREYLLRQFSAEIRHHDGFIVRNSWDAKAQRIISHRILDGIEDPRNVSSMRLYTPGQMRHLFERADLTIENVYGSLAGDPYRKTSPQMLTVGRKQKNRL